MSGTSRYSKQSPDEIRGDMLAARQVADDLTVAESLADLRQLWLDGELPGWKKCPTSWEAVAESRIPELEKIERKLSLSRGKVRKTRSNGPQKRRI